MALRENIGNAFDAVWPVGFLALTLVGGCHAGKVAELEAQVEVLKNEMAAAGLEGGDSSVSNPCVTSSHMEELDFGEATSEESLNERYALGEDWVREQGELALGERQPCAYSMLVTDGLANVVGSSSSSALDPATWRADTFAPGEDVLLSVAIAFPSGTHRGEYRVSCSRDGEIYDEGPVRELPELEGPNAKWRTYESCSTSKDDEVLEVTVEHRSSSDQVWYGIGGLKLYASQGQTGFTEAPSLSETD